MISQKMKCFLKLFSKRMDGLKSRSINIGLCCNKAVRNLPPCLFDRFGLCPLSPRDAVYRHVHGRDVRCYEISHVDGFQIRDHAFLRRWQLRLRHLW